MSLQDVEVVKSFLAEKFKENFEWVKTNTRESYYVSASYKFYLRTSFIDNTVVFKDDILSRLQSTFKNIVIEKNKNYLMERSAKGSYVVIPYIEIEV
ncbi:MULTISPECIES: hypothetical protein [Aeromonas]|uniref:Uncharacterized protein n=1 Tax=Aeromonas caviae TaxID=648 RepID=A0AA43AHU9_AERCA|nr:MULTISPECIES: hypothetical protein [Aeromonas]MDH1897996.1 hypothetical protein [Aeromonas caviae]